MEYYHLSHIVHQNAKKFGDEEALRVRDRSTQSWRSVSWSDFSKKVITVAETLSHMGVKPQSNIGVYSQNKIESFYVDFGAFANRAVVVPMYATASIPQITYIIKEAEIKILFVGEQWQYDNAWQVLKKNRFLKQLIIFDKNVQKAEEDDISVYFESFCSPKNRSSQDIAAVQRRMREASDEDLAHIIYTSGTTRGAKGVMLTHSNYKEVMKTHDIRLNYLPQRFLSLCFLPLAHVFEKAWSIYCIHRGCTLAICEEPQEVLTCMKEICPEAMCSVPRFWEKVYNGVQEKIDSFAPLFKRICLNAIETGGKFIMEYKNENRKAPWLLKIKFNLYNKTIFHKLKKTLGIEKGLIFPVAGAILSDKINIFLQSVNIPLIYGYGLTETTATVSCYTHTGFTVGTVGKVMPYTEIRIGENNEILVKALSVMKGYYKKTEATARAFTDDGFFRTGDAGYLTENMEIVITDRLKDLYKTSNGKYIAPQQLEARLMDDRFIDSAVVIGDQRKYVTALIIPAFEEVKNYVDRHQIPFDDMEDLYNNVKIQELFMQRINAMQNEFAGYEQIKRFTLLTEPFSIHTGELTNTLKMKRAFIAEKYKELIDKMYEES
jgi:long-chain acyl-CoA synthetase